MDVITAIKTRRSIRKYESKAIPRETIESLLESARRAPSGKNLQPWELVVVTDPGTKTALVPLCCNQRFVGECSVVIAGVDDPTAKWQRVDLAIAMEHIVLAAVELGLGTCWIGCFDPEEVKTILNVPKNKALVALLTVGYPAEAPKERRKKPLEQLVHRERYGTDMD